MPARTQNSSSARMYGASGSSSSREASPMTIETGRTGGGASRWRGAASPSPSGRRTPRRPSRACAGARSRPASAAGPPRPSARPSAAPAPPRSRRRPARARRRPARRRASWCRRQSLARAGDRRGDRQPLLQRVAQRRHLAVGEQPVLARRSLRLREPEPPLPRPQRVRADVQQRRRLARLEIAHAQESRLAGAISTHALRL